MAVFGLARLHGIFDVFQETQVIGLVRTNRLLLF